MRTISGGPEELVLGRLLSNHTYPQVEHECYYGLGMDGCSGDRKLLEHERYYGAWMLL